MFLFFYFYQESDGEDQVISHGSHHPDSNNYMELTEK